MSSLEYLRLHASEPEARAVLEDVLAERGESLIGLVWAIAADADATAAADAAAADADADAAADAADADAATANANADATAAAAAAADKRRLTHLPGGEMREGLSVLQVSGSGGWLVTRVGWLRRVAGDEWELVAGRTITRASWGTERVSISALAGRGLAEGHAVGEVDPVPEQLHRLLVRRGPFAADEKAWAKECPRPKGWVDNK